MIPSNIPTISEILTRLDITPGRRGRSRCPIHRGDNSQALSVDKTNRVWYCHRCGFGGNAVELVKKALDLSFPDAMRWLGHEPGQPIRVDPEAERKRLIRRQLKQWIEAEAKELRFDHYVRERIIARAEKRLRLDPEDERGWRWLAWAYRGMDAISYRLDALDGNDEAVKVAYYKRRKE